ncbi:ferritin-like domain-containing protein [Rariglobus hedericola]|uniref:Ferritin-like domain-containing protein n=1 Tax=Rariglobus hedericola TaxID=2597822 RepID=A0A556QQE1_9BACT|nr:ferritin-like domain-containing protein [Rariglobus hedericola]TSJ78849.1 ferritin-like domain-containing protein [Rariglobus hedericola]
MTYADYLSQSERQRWLIETDIDWDNVNAPASLTQPDLLKRLRDAALIESFFPILTPRVLDVLWDDPAATAIFSVQLYESYKHFHVFNLYLEKIGWNPLNDDDLVAVRRRNIDLHYDSPTRVLTQYFMSEHFAAHAFFKDSRAALDPVLKRILHLVAQDEVRHSQFGYELLSARIERHPAERAIVIEAARSYTHFGALVVDEVPIAEKNDFTAIVGLNQRLVRLCGEGIAV